MKHLRNLLPVAALTVSTQLFAGPYDGPGGTPGSLAIPRDSTSIVGWASGVSSLTRGPAQSGVPEGDPSFAGYATYGEPSFVLGPATGEVFDTVSLGDGGSITVTFDAPITNGPGADFAVFENGFENFPGAWFLELGFVEVSSNGSDFFRFPAISLTQTTTQVLGFEPLDPTDLHNFAGKHQAGFGTPFDLAEIAALYPSLDTFAVTHVRIIDVVGTISLGLGGTVDSLGNLVNDPYSTPFPTGGFDLEAVGVLHTVPEPSHAVAAVAAVAAAFAVLRRRRFSRS